MKANLSALRARSPLKIVIWAVPIAVLLAVAHT